VTVVRAAKAVGIAATVAPAASAKVATTVPPPSSPRRSCVATITTNRHCEERSDAAIQTGLLRFARNDE